MMQVTASISPPSCQNSFCLSNEKLYVRACAEGALESLLQEPCCVGNDLCSFLWKLGTLLSPLVASNIFQVEVNPFVFVQLSFCTTDISAA